MCTTASSQTLPPLSSAEIEALRRTGLETSSKLEFVRGPLDRAEHRIGAGTTPSGALLYISAFGQPKGIADAWDVVLHIPLGPMELVLSIRNVPAEHKFHMQAALLLAGVVIAETEFDVRYGNPGSFNNVGFVENIAVHSHHPSILDSCFLECIKRHAPQCVGPCMGGVTSWACIICAGTAVACCATNCHC